MNVVYLGTPDFAVKPLEKIFGSRHNLIAVVTQTDKPKGRSGKPAFSPVKEAAISLGVPVLQYEKIRKEGVDDLKRLNADIFVTCAYGQILSQEIIDIPRHGIINIHASLLPKYRGAAPVQWSVINGDARTGVTIMKTEAGIDTGPILTQKSLEIGEEETAGELFERLSDLGAEMITEALDLIESGKAVFTEQANAEATYIKMLKKEDGLIDWSRSAEEVRNLVRGVNPWPSAYTYYCGKLLKIWSVEISRDTEKKGDAGEILSSDKKDGITVSTGSGALKIKELQLEGCKRMTAKDFLLGRSFTVGEKFSEK